MTQQPTSYDTRVPTFKQSLEGSCQASNGIAKDFRARKYTAQPAQLASTNPRIYNGLVSHFATDY